MRLAWGDAAFDQAVADYVLSQFPEIGRYGVYKPFRSVALTRGGQAIGGIVMTNYRGFDAELSIYLAERGFVGRHALTALFHWAFNELKLARLTCYIATKNRASRKFVTKLGFRHEGTLRHGLDGTRDAQIYGMTKADCFWLKD